MEEAVLTVRTERTPNPLSLKYNLGRPLLPGSSANFPTAEAAARSPLARRVFTVEGVDAVFIGPDFLTVTRREDVDWATINEGMAPALEDFFASGEPVLEGTPPAETKTEIGDPNADPELVARIKGLIEEKVRPAVAQDGGDITYLGFADGVVFLQMHGSCSGCPSATVTLKNGVESMLKHYCPEVREVRQA